MRNKFQAKDIIISGDFNMDRRMDENPTSSKFSKKGETRHADFFDSILNLGFHDCLRKFHSLPIQTYRHNRGTYPWELDHMFATPELYNRLKSINVYVDENILSLSDHNPIVAEFED
jgi:exonuclease III